MTTTKGDTAIFFAVSFAQAGALAAVLAFSREAELQNAPAAFQPLYLGLSFIPIVAMTSLGSLSNRVVAFWTLGLACVVAALGYFQAVRGAPPRVVGSSLAPGLGVWGAIGGGLVLAQALALARWARSAPRTMGRATPNSASDDEALAQRDAEDAPPEPWSARFCGELPALAFRLGLAAMFAAIVFLALTLAADLFRMIELDGLRRLMLKDWFVVPVLALAGGAAIFLMRRQSGAIETMRRLAMTLLSWLSAPMTLAAAAFLLALPFTTLEPLWRTKKATILLMAAAATVWVGVQAVRRTGEAEPMRGVRGLAMRLGALELIPLVCLAMWALGLRVAQHGWSADRVVAAALVGLAGALALGYAAAVIGRRQAWLDRADAAVAMAAVVAIFCLMTPLADPARLMTASQMERLSSGATSPLRFDYRALKFDGARWGAAALARLSDDPRAPGGEEGRVLARAALKAENRYEGYARALMRTPEEVKALFALTSEVEGLDKIVAELDARLGRWALEDCAKAPCPVRPAPPSSGFETAILIGLRHEAALLEKTPKGWRLAGRYSNYPGCRASIDALLSEALEFVPARRPDLRLGAAYLYPMPERDPRCGK